MNQLLLAIATGFYVGFLPIFPGTWGSAAAILPYYFVRSLSIPTYLVMLAVLFIIGFFSAGAAEKILDRADAGPIVIDEILGMLITLAFAPAHPVYWLLGFVLFRVFDILKPFPVSWFDNHIHGGIGIMMDDVIAGLYALGCLQLTHLIVSRFIGWTP